MKTLDPPKEEMNIDPPTYQEITIINYMRSSASPSLIDEINIKIYKKTVRLLELC